MKDLLRPLALIYSYMAQGERENRANQPFTKESMIPPLPELEPDNKYGKAIPVLYTNDPRSASRWCQEHLSERPVAVGWDVEVSLITY
jgi:hypothetical protein